MSPSGGPPRASLPVGRVLKMVPKKFPEMVLKWNPKKPPKWPTTSSTRCPERRPEIAPLSNGKKWDLNGIYNTLERSKLSEKGPFWDHFRIHFRPQMVYKRVFRGILKTSPKINPVWNPFRGPLSPSKWEFVSHVYTCEHTWNTQGPWMSKEGPKLSQKWPKMVPKVGSKSVDCTKNGLHVYSKQMYDKKKRRGAFL